MRANVDWAGCQGGSNKTNRAGRGAAARGRNVAGGRLRRKGWRQRGAVIYPDDFQGGPPGRRPRRYVAGDKPGQMQGEMENPPRGWKGPRAVAQYFSCNETNAATVIHES